MVSMHWKEVVCGAPSSGCQGSNILDSTEGKEAEGLCCVDLNETLNVERVYVYMQILDP